jgi:bleomycin hydrolase
MLLIRRSHSYIFGAYNLPIMNRLLIVVFSCISFVSFSQDNLVNSLSANASDQSKQKFSFTPVINLTCTDVKNQGSSGTCWSYSGNSFLESEMIRNGKQPVDIAEIYTARCVYIEKAKNYVRMHGSVNWGDGGELHDVTNMYAKYGALPQEVYSGLNYGYDMNKFAEMQDVLKGMLDGVIKNANGKLTNNWINAFTAAVDSYLGKVPEEFTYKGKKYTPLTFAKEVVGINAADYIEFGSLDNSPYYEKIFFPVPDNWSFDQVYNVQINDLTDIIDNALKQGYTVGWATDVSEKYFSWKNGIAYVPAVSVDKMTGAQQQEMFNGPKEEMEITPAMRQLAFDNYETQDDHGMQIVGMSKDQNGKEYYIVKNSWGKTNDYQGFLYVTKNYVKYKTTALMVNKNAVSKGLKSKLKM